MDYFMNFDKMNYVTKKRDDRCALCLVAQNDPDALDYTIDSSEFFIACINMYPYNPGHLMIFPKKHLEDIRQFDSMINEDLLRFQKKLLDVLDTLYKPAAYNIGYNMGLDAGASMTHLHLHIIPRYPHEIGFADILSGKKILVENPLDTREKLRAAIEKLRTSQG